MRRLAAVGITTREACGNSVRNVTACPLAGVCRDETFDVTPYAKAMRVLPARPSRHAGLRPQVQDRLLRLRTATPAAWSTCTTSACIAVTQDRTATSKRGFEIYVGGGLGAVPHQAKLFDEFVPEEELLPLAQAIGRVFARLGEKKNRSTRAHQVPGREARHRRVPAAGARRARQAAATIRAGRQYLDEIAELRRDAAQARRVAERRARSPTASTTWRATNVYRAAAARLRRRHRHAAARRHHRRPDARARRHRPQVRRRHRAHDRRAEHRPPLGERGRPARRSTASSKRIGLGDAGAGTIVDVTACPGTDTCKLGIASSRGLAGELRNAAGRRSRRARRRRCSGLHIKISGCFNSCGQHHVADLGFYGISRNIGGYTVPHFQVVLGGKWADNGGSYGLAIGAVPSKHIPDAGRPPHRALRRASARATRRFQDFCAAHRQEGAEGDARRVREGAGARRGRRATTPTGATRASSRIGDMGIGECAGEVVSLVEFDLADAEREAFEAQLAARGRRRSAKADALAYHAMLQAAKALVQTQLPRRRRRRRPHRRRVQDALRRHRALLRPVRQRQVRQLPLRRHDEGAGTVNAESAHQLVEEASLFVEAGHACQLRLAQKKVGPAAAARPRSSAWKG